MVLFELLVHSALVAFNRSCWPCLSVSLQAFFSGEALKGAAWTGAAFHTLGCQVKLVHVTTVAVV